VNNVILIVDGQVVLYLFGPVYPTKGGKKPGNLSGGGNGKTHNPCLSPDKKLAEAIAPLLVEKGTDICLVWCLLETGITKSTLLVLLACEK